MFICVDGPVWNNMGRTKGKKLSREVKRREVEKAWNERGEGTLVILFPHHARREEIEGDQQPEEEGAFLVIHPRG